MNNSRYSTVLYWFEFIPALSVYYIYQTGADLGIDYEGQEGMHKSMNIITKGEGGAQEYSTM